MTMIKYWPKEADSAVERIEFVKDGKMIVFVNRFDEYAVYVDEDDDEFDLDGYDPDEGMDTMSEIGWSDEDEGERIEYSIEGDITEEEKAELISAFEEQYECGPEELGWEWSDRYVWFYGPIGRKKIK